MNKTILVGRIGRTPDVKVTKGGTAVANFSVATDEFYGGESHTEWHRVVAWGKNAEFVGAYLSKGALVEIDGRNQTREWEDKDGNKRQTTEIHVNFIKSLIRGEENASSSENTSANSGKEDEFEDDDIPF